MKTAFMLMAQYDAQVVIPIEAVCRDYFSHLTTIQFSRKISDGDIDLPLVRIETSQKAMRGIHIEDLAKWIDKRREAAVKENNQIHGRR